ncbi:MAG TPA: MFS transporter [Kofleriaceae bacterium]|nr:MFS transporter [Kofleriaceae bacterium]
MELLDELYSGVPSIGAPAIQRDLGASYQEAAWALLLVPTLVALAIEPALFLLADRHGRAWFVRGGALAMALAAFAAAAAPSIPVLTAAVALSFVATGAAVTTAQAALVDVHPHDRERVMTRWTMMGVLGDLAAPALAAALAAASLGWRGAYLVVGAAVGVWAIALMRVRFPAGRGGAAAGDGDDGDGDGGDGGGEGDDAPLLSSLWMALRRRRLLAWLFGAALCELLDEILVIFAALHLRDELGAGEAARALMIGGLVLGEAVGLALAERMLRRGPPLRLLALSGGACAVTYLAWLAAPTLWLSAILLVLVGLTAAPLYPITMAQAYAALPDRAGAVQAAGHLFTPLTMLLPWLLGWLADHHGTAAALLVLLAQPVGITILALAARRREPGAPRRGRAPRGRA